MYRAISGYYKTGGFAAFCRTSSDSDSASMTVTFAKHDTLAIVHTLHGQTSNIVIILTQ